MPVTIPFQMGTGRKEFSPKRERPGLEEYIKEAGQGTLKLHSVALRMLMNV